MVKKSTNLIVLAFIMLFLLSANIVIIYYLTNNIEDDASIINNSGIIRGSIQRIIKLELNGIKSDELMEETDKVFENFERHKIILKEKKQDFTSLFQKVKENWAEIKSMIDDYRMNRTEEGRKLVLEKSEEVWKNSNDMVMIAQLISQGKVRNFYILILLLVINMLPTIVLIIYIKAYVKDKLEFLATHDPLTRTFNRNFLYTFLNNEIERVDRYSYDLSLIMVDIDHFKNINDRFGHDTGDIVLKELAEIFTSNVRKSDVVARYGGEEFIIVAVQTKPENAVALAEKIRLVVEEHSFKGIGKITVSLGVSSYTEGDDIDSLSKRADTALYLAKNNGRNRTEIDMPTKY